MRLQELSAAVFNNRHLQDVSLQDLELFGSLVVHLRPTISRVLPHSSQYPPTSLPANIHNFLVISVGVPDSTVKHLWETLSRSLWAEPAGDRSSIAQGGRLLPYFLQHGLSLGLGMMSFAVTYYPSPEL